MLQLPLCENGTYVRNMQSATFNGANREAFSKVTSKEPNDHSNGVGNDEDEKEPDVAAPFKGKGRLGSVRDEERRGLSSFN